MLTAKNGRLHGGCGHTERRAVDDRRYEASSPFLDSRSDASSRFDLERDHMRESQACVIIAVRLEDDDLGTEADDRFVEAIEQSIRDRLEIAPELGHWDGHEFGGGWSRIF